jgi:hypothetical protein
MKTPGLWKNYLFIQWLVILFRFPQKDGGAGLCYFEYMDITDNSPTEVRDSAVYEGCSAKV